MDGHRAPLADLLNQQSLSADCCRAMHFVTIRDHDDSASSDSDASNENGSLSDECVDTAAADDSASLPAVDVVTAVSVPPAGSSSVREPLSSATVKEHCRVQRSPLLHDTINSSSPTASARSGRGSTIQTPSAGAHCQHICMSCCCCC